MSSILKALKKLEDEKSIRKPDSLKIDAEILRGDSARRFSPMGISLLAALLFICGSGATYFFMSSDTNNVKATVSDVVPIDPPSPATAVAPDAERPHNLNLKADLPKPDKVVTAAGSDNKLGNTPPSSVTVPRLQAKIQPVQRIRQSEEKRPVAPPQSAPATTTRPVASVMAPLLKVNGIAFQEESVERVAIVNGAPVSNGSIIEGAKVEDIQKDRVRFSYGGEKFDVALGKSNR